jgi:hypothetical protein
VASTAPAFVHPAEGAGHVGAEGGEAPVDLLELGAEALEARDVGGVGRDLGGLGEPLRVDLAVELRERLSLLAREVVEQPLQRHGARRVHERPEHLARGGLEHLERRDVQVARGRAAGHRH